jgi:hypothetical protein
MSNSLATLKVWGGYFKSEGDGNAENTLDIMILPANMMTTGTPLELNTQTCKVNPDEGTDLYKGEAIQAKNIGFGVKNPIFSSRS